MSRRSLLYRKKLMQLGQLKCSGGGGRTCGMKCEHAHTVPLLPRNIHEALDVLSRHDKFAMSQRKIHTITWRYAGRR